MVQREREADVYCETDAGCDDGDEWTEDFCLIDETCGHLPVCVATVDCPAGRSGVSVECQGGYCLYLCNACPSGDLTGDGKVNAIDLARVLQRWGKPDSPERWMADYDRNGDVGLSDLFTVLQNWKN